MHTFHHHFLQFLASKNIEVTHSLQDSYDYLFLNSWAAPYSEVKKSLRLNAHAVVMHRIDGSAKDYGRTRFSDIKQARLNRFADVTVFMSEYSKWVTGYRYGLVDTDGPVIPNPTDLNLFTPPTDKETPERVRVSVVAHSTNAKKGNSTINGLAKSHPELDFVLMGNFNDVEDRPNVTRRGRLGRAELSKEMASCSIHLQLSVNDACPNVVVEALASGLPVVFKRSGGTPEIVGDAGSEFSFENFDRVIRDIMENYEEYSKAARLRAESLFDPKLVFEKYLHEMTSARKTRSKGFLKHISLMLESLFRLTVLKVTVDEGHRGSFDLSNIEIKD